MDLSVYAALSFAGSSVRKAWTQKTMQRHWRFVSTLMPFFGDNCSAFLKIQFQTCYWVLLKTEHLIPGHWAVMPCELPIINATMAGLHHRASYEEVAPMKLRMSRSWRHRQVTEKVARIFTSWTLVRFSQLTPMTSRGICSNQLTENKGVRLCL